MPSLSRVTIGRLSACRTMQCSRPLFFAAGVLLFAALMGAGCGYAQSTDPAPDATASAPAGPHADAPAGLHPIAIVPLDTRIEGAASVVNGDMQVFNGRAFMTANASVSAGDATTHVTLPYRGVLLVCSQTTVKLAADATVKGADVPGLLLAMDHGAIEMSFATIRNSDTLLTPDFRILISGPGAADIKVRLGPRGDTCVDNAGAKAPYVTVSSVFDGGAYRVQPGQRVMFQHGSLHEVVDQEKESCGCPPPEPKGNEFPVGQSEHLALHPNAAPPMPSEASGSSEPIAPLVYKSADHVPQSTAGSETNASQNANAQATAAPQKKPNEKKDGFFAHVGRFFKRIFGAE